MKVIYCNQYIIFKIIQKVQKSLRNRLIFYENGNIFYNVHSGFNFFITIST